MIGVHRPTAILVVVLCAAAMYASLEVLRTEASDSTPRPAVVTPQQVESPPLTETTAAEVEADQAKRDRAAARRLRALRARRKREERRMRRTARAAREQAAAFRAKRRAGGPPPAPTAPAAPAAPAPSPTKGDAEEKSAGAPTGESPSAAADQSPPPAAKAPATPAPAAPGGEAKRK